MSSIPKVMSIATEKIFDYLNEVKDPEIPVLSLVDLGVIRDVCFQGDTLKIVMTPTFVGCPALDLMKQEIVDVLAKKGIEKVEIEISFREPWTSDLISEKGRAAIKAFGLAPPPSSSNLFTDLDVLEHVPCPRCNSTDTDLRNPFGGTLCRSIHYCNHCHEAFEQFKPV